MTSKGCESDNHHYKKTAGYDLSGRILHRISLSRDSDASEQAVACLTFIVPFRYSESMSDEDIFYSDNMVFAN